MLVCRSECLFGSASCLHMLGPLNFENIFGVYQGASREYSRLQKVGISGLGTIYASFPPSVGFGVEGQSYNLLASTVLGARLSLSQAFTTRASSLREALGPRRMQAHAAPVCALTWLLSRNLQQVGRTKKAYCLAYVPVTLI